MSRYTGANKKKIERKNINVEKVMEAVGSIQGQTQKFINEWTEKFNKLGAMVDGVFKTATTEIGQIWAACQKFADSIDHMDANILAMAKLQKDLYLRSEVTDRMMKKLSTLAEDPLDVDLADSEKAAAETYHAQVKKAFTEIVEQRKKEHEDRANAQKAAEAEAVLAQQAQKEAETAEAALKEAEGKPKFEDLSTAGGQGADIPEDATVFGGQ